MKENCSLAVHEHVSKARTLRYNWVSLSNVCCVVGGGEQKECEVKEGNFLKSRKL